ncbi:MAG: hypothetical protein DRO90_02500 [Candidatus Altiarchaeales archaeon]|nr:MAG: hypothetical protein DRO95_04250 [Candidatus Altiarchaeales archaeon]RLI94132.1 MAG: hypothetical protein DRO94_03610 [Candidatus Altiarchaeales archaeon]RLI94144.1 MAG: hypothetical protein DRO90_02500 [Candidatus Altiarchaeales archaeon]HDO82494.1 DUF47 domain-containing protein [Candidatus Altiarchaeales archaeon]HEX55143.1 DUF47 domain-containing protein [Candidatus Altiarchaeales archaeon]
MRISDIIPYIGKGREEETMKLLVEHAELTYDVVVELKNALNAFIARDKELLNEKVEFISSMESKADKLRRDIEENMYSGAFLPLSRSRILDLAERIDNIADVAQDAARLLLFINVDKIDKKIIEFINEQLQYGLKSSYMLVKCISEIRNSENLKNIREFIKEIRRYEHSSDIIERKALSILYSNEYDANTTLLLYNLIKYMGDVSDCAEDASDALSLIVIMHTA